MLDRNIYRKIEYHLYNYKGLRQEIEQQRKEAILGGRQAIGEAGGGRSRHSDPTALKALELCRREIAETEKWLRVVEATISKYRGTDKQRLIDLKYSKGLNEIRICMELNIARRTYFRWRQDVITYAALVAAQKGMIKVA